MLDPSKIPAVQWTLFVLQVVTLVALIVYVWKTWEMASATRRAAAASQDTLLEMREQQRAAKAPRVALYFETVGSHLAHVVLENTGATTATNIRFQFSPALVAASSDRSTEFFNGSKTLPPGSRVRHLFDSWPDYFGKDLPRQYQVQLSYTALGSSETYTDTQLLDAGAFENLHFTVRKDVHDLVAEMERLRGDLGKALKRTADVSEDIVGVLEGIAPVPGFRSALNRAWANWRLLRSLSEQHGVYWNRDALRSAIRQDLLAAIRADADNGYNDETQQLLRDAYSALHDAKLSYGDRTEGYQQMDDALQRIRDHTGA